MPRSKTAGEMVRVLALVRTPQTVTHRDWGCQVLAFLPKLDMVSLLIFCGFNLHFLND